MKITYIANGSLEVKSIEDLEEIRNKLMELTKKYKFNIYFDDIEVECEEC
jgi:hypothetical protein